jgi:hypothetical protein
MGHTPSTEPQCLYKSDLYLYLLHFEFVKGNIGISLEHDASIFRVTELFLGIRRTCGPGSSVGITPG